MKSSIFSLPFFMSKTETFSYHLSRMMLIENTSMAKQSRQTTMTAALSRATSRDDPSLTSAAWHKARAYTLAGPSFCFQLVFVCLLWISPWHGLSKTVLTLKDIEQPALPSHCSSKRCWRSHRVCASAMPPSEQLATVWTRVSRPEPLQACSLSASPKASNEERVQPS